MENSLNCERIRRHLLADKIPNKIIGNMDGNVQRKHKIQEEETIWIFF